MDISKSQFAPMVFKVGERYVAWNTLFVRDHNRPFQAAGTAGGGLSLQGWDSDTQAVLDQE
jgi:hypothetical protein